MLEAARLDGARLLENALNDPELTLAQVSHEGTQPIDNQRPLFFGTTKSRVFFVGTTTLVWGS